MFDKAKYVKWYNLAKDAIGNTNLIPERKPDEIVGFISKEDWLMFTHLPNLDLAKRSPFPNVYFDLRENNTGIIGLTFNTVKSVDRLNNILSEFSSNENIKLKQALLNLENVWSIVVSRKTKAKHFNQKPEWKEEFRKRSNEINENIIDQVMEKCNTIREEGREKLREVQLKRQSKRVSFRETPVVDLMVCDFPLSEDEFRKRIKEAFNALEICLMIKSNSQLREIQKHSKIRKPVTKPMKCPFCNSGIRGQIKNGNKAVCQHCGNEFDISSENIDR